MSRYRGRITSMRSRNRRNFRKWQRTHAATATSTSTFSCVPCAEMLMPARAASTPIAEPQGALRIWCEAGPQTDVDERPAPRAQPGQDYFATNGAGSIQSALVRVLSTHRSTLHRCSVMRLLLRRRLSVGRDAVQRRNHRRSDRYRSGSILPDEEPSRIPKYYGTRAMRFECFVVIRGRVCAYLCRCRAHR